MTLFFKIIASKQLQRQKSATTLLRLIPENWPETRQRLAAIVTIMTAAEASGKTVTRQILIDQLGITVPIYKNLVTAFNRFLPNAAIELGLYFYSDTNGRASVVAKAITGLIAENPTGPITWAMIADRYNRGSEQETVWASLNRWVSTSEDAALQQAVKQLNAHNQSEQIISRPADFDEKAAHFIAAVTACAAAYPHAHITYEQVHQQLRTNHPGEYDCHWTNIFSWAGRYADDSGIAAAIETINTHDLKTLDVEEYLKTLPTDKLRIVKKSMLYPHFGKSKMQWTTWEQKSGFDLKTSKAKLLAERAGTDTLTPAQSRTSQTTHPAKRTISLVRAPAKARASDDPTVIKAKLDSWMKACWRALAAGNPSLAKAYYLYYNKNLELARQLKLDQLPEYEEKNRELNEKLNLL